MLCAISQTWASSWRLFALPVYLAAFASLVTASLSRHLCFCSSDRRARSSSRSVVQRYPLLARRRQAYPLAANPPKGSPVAPCVIIPSQTAAVRDSQHRRATVHVHRFHGVCQWLILILIDQRSAFRVVHLNHCRATA